MRRDPDLIRSILLTVEAADGPIDKLQIEGYDDLIVAEHALLLYEAGYLKGAFYTRGGMGRHLAPARVTRLTWDGHEFLAAARPDSVWQRAKERVGDELATMPFSILRELLLSLGRGIIGGGT